LPVEINEISKNSRGGTELMAQFLRESLDPVLLDKFQIIPSRIRDLDPTKVRIFYGHDLPADGESKPLENGGHEKFHKLVFVSHWQQQAYINHYNLPWSKTMVLQNAIDPIPLAPKPETPIRLIYHTTPHRGLNIVIPVFERLVETFGDKIHLDVYSSFEIYGWGEQDKRPEFQNMYDRVKAHPNMTYYGTVSNEDVRNALAQSHIFAYPSIWPETSCICLMEAMSAGLICVHPDFAALPETAANLTYMYGWHESQNEHAKIFYAMLKEAIELALTNPKPEDTKVGMAKTYADLFYGKEMRKAQWTQLLKSLEGLPTAIPSGPTFHYRTS
jgi:UDP-glucose:(glucosyl)LPS alpha-1,2-glucosyltransferase